MKEKTQQYIEMLFTARKLAVPPNRSNLFDQFCQEAHNAHAVKQILDNQKVLMENWKRITRIKDIQEQPLSIPNGTVGKPYEAAINFQQLNWTDIVQHSLSGLEPLGLTYDPSSQLITGIPVQSGDIKLLFSFKTEAEPEESALNEKKLSLIINPDPKSLWKNLDSDQSDPYWKEDNVAVSAPLGNRHLVVASKRGRSHANVGSFRDDDFTYTHFEQNGWSLVAVADGAGSARLSRQGSKIACNSVVTYFAANLTAAVTTELDALLKEQQEGKGEDTQNKLNHFVYNNLGKAALYVHKQLEAFATQEQVVLKDLHSTLIFVLVKQYTFGYAILSFGVGDCPIGIVSKDLSSVSLMNWLDVGEFGGGTRFITMPEIFNSEKFHTRFGCKIVDDFSYLALMTDGIYDPKFVTEANLEKIEQWRVFIEDLKGNNVDGTRVDFTATNPEIASQLSDWMDFWSAGDHDDRTLAIVF
jgi:serine/threonine protein phosphatase PrpC